MCRIVQYCTVRYISDMHAPTFDIGAARAALIASGITNPEAFLAKEILTASEAAIVLGVKDGRTARDTLTRWNIRPVSRAAGRGGESEYTAALVWHGQQNRPRPGRPLSSTPKDPTMTALLESPDLPWYVASDQVVEFARALTSPGCDVLATPEDVVEYFAAPRKWTNSRNNWIANGKPDGPELADLIDAEPTYP